MLASKFRLAKEKDFQRIFKQGRSVQAALFRIKILKNNLEVSRFAIVISNKISKKAAVRNRLKRQISEILRINLTKIKRGFDVVIVVKPVIIGSQYKEIEEVLMKSLKSARIFL